MNEEEKQEVRKSAGISYLCGFCEKAFKKASDCAKHIEEESDTGIVYPADIVMVS